MENNQEIILKKLNELNLEYSDKKAKYQTCNSLMIKVQSFVNNHERLLKNKKEKLSTLIICLLSFVILPLVVIVICLSHPDFLNAFNTFIGGFITTGWIIAGSIFVALGIKAIIKSFKDLIIINKQIKVNEIKYDEQKKLLPSYIKAESVTYHKLKELEQKIKETKVQLSKLNGNQVEEIKTLIKEQYPNLYFNDEFDNCLSKETKNKTLVKTNK